MFKAISAAAIALVLLACGGSDNPTTPPSPAATEARAATPAPDAALACRDIAAESSRPGCFYTGPLFDTHLHLGAVLGNLGDDNSGDEQLRMLLARDGIAWAIGFYSVPPPLESNASMIQAMRGIASRARANVVPLIEPYPEHFGRGLYLPVEQWLVPQGPFVGVGEFPLYAGSFTTLTLDSPQFLAVFAGIGNMQGIVMIHPRSSLNPPLTTTEEMRAAIAANPGVLFLFHGGVESIDRILPLMDEFPNVYLTWDFATWPKPGVSYSTAKTQEQFLAQVEQSGVDRIVRYVVQEVEPRLSRHPDRIMWGTDRFEPYHFEGPSSSLIMEISRLVLARLPAELREKYAYQNALRVFGRYLNPPR
jgi:hypothetical protein